MNISFAFAKSRTFVLLLTVPFSWSLLKIIRSFRANSVPQHRLHAAVPQKTDSARVPPKGTRNISATIFKDQAKRFPSWRIFSSDNFTQTKPPICPIVDKRTNCQPGGAMSASSGTEFTYIAKLRPRIACHHNIRRQLLSALDCTKRSFQLADSLGNSISLLLRPPIAGQIRAGCAAQLTGCSYFVKARVNVVRPSGL